MDNFKAYMLKKAYQRYQKLARASNEKDLVMKQVIKKDRKRGGLFFQNELIDQDHGGN